LKRARAVAAILLGAGLLAAGAARAEPGLAIPRPFHVIAHRGASTFAPENTLPAFARALEIGVVEVELDVQLSSDSVPVLFHDDTLDEKTPLHGSVREHSAEALTRADIGLWFDHAHPDRPQRWAGTRLTTLPVVFAAFGAKLYYHVEIKDELEETPAKVLAAVAAARLAERVMLTSFRRNQLERARRLAPNVPVCWLLRSPLPEQLDAAREAGFAMVGVRASEITRELVQAAHARGLQIRAFGVESSEVAMERALLSGCNGMTLDVPERLVARLLEALRVPERGPAD
jgi:glycerophosphoryl diester phosphodiesterase